MHRNQPIRPMAIGKRRREAGFSLVEIALVLFIFTLVAGNGVVLVLESELAVADQVRRLYLAQSGQRLLERLASELRNADPDTITPAVLDRSSSVTFNRVLGYKDGARVLSLPLRFQLTMGPGERRDGLKDDNGDGRVDEGLISYTEGASGPITLAENVLDFRLTFVSEVIEFSFRLGLVDGRSGEILERSYNGKVKVRN